MSAAPSNVRPAFDQVITDIAAYVDGYQVKMVVHEDKRYTRGFFDPLKRSNANAVLVHFRDGTRTSRVEVEYPVGHRQRRREGIPRLVGKFEQNLARVYAEKQRRIVLGRCLDRARLCAMPVDGFFDLLCSNHIGICA
jgi:2-methylcitrate dehydratase